MVFIFDGWLVGLWCSFLMVGWLVYGVQFDLLTQYFSFIVAVSFLMIKYYSENWLCEVTKVIKHLKSEKDLTFKEDFNLLDD